MKRVSGIGGVFVMVLASLAGGKLLGEDATTTRNLVQRYGQTLDLKRYPQSDPQGTIRSIIKATTAGKIEYMLAHLISPGQVDKKLQGNQKAFRALAAKATPKKSKKMIAALTRQLNDGTWIIWRHMAWSHADGVADLSLEKIGNRWFMHNTPIKKP